MSFRRLLSPPPQRNGLSGILLTIEINLICCALTQTSGSQTQAADLLGIKNTTLGEKLHRFGIDPSRFKNYNLSFLTSLT